MFLIDIAIALTIALFLTGLFALGLRRTGPWNNSILLFLVLFLAAWAGGIWIGPVGISLWGYSWFEFAIAGILAGIVLIVISPLAEPANRPSVNLETKEEAQRNVQLVDLSTISLVVVVLGLIGAIAARYLFIETVFKLG